MKKKAICFLTLRPNETYFNLIEIFTKFYDVYVCIDDNKHKLNFNYSKKIKIIKYPNIVPKKEGFIHTVMYFKNRSCSRDKALYYFSKNENIKKYTKLWFIEEDVFIPSFKTIKNIDEKYNKSNDLLCQGFIKFKNQNDWNKFDTVRKDAAGIVKLPYYRSMICAIRVSSKMLKVIKNFAHKYKTLFMDEALFPTLAKQKDLKINVIPELKSVVYRREWRYVDIKKENLYHPIKDINVQVYWRNKLKKK